MVSIIKLRLLNLRDDYKILLGMMALALVLTFIMGSSMGNYRPVVLIIDEDTSDSSGKLIGELTQIKSYKFEFSDYSNAINEVENRKALTAVLIKKGFEESISNGKNPSIGIIKSKEDVDILALENIISGISKKMLGNIKIAEVTADYINMFNKDINREMIYDKAYNKAVESWKYRNPVHITSEMLNVEEYNKYDNLMHLLIGFSLLFSMYTITFSVGNILQDKRFNVWQRMMISPVSGAEILGGTMLITFLTGALQIAILFLSGKFLFNIAWGNNIGGIILIGVTFVLATTCLGLFLSGIVKTHAQLSAITPIVLTGSAMLGGCMWPLEIVNSKILLGLANLTPQKWAIQGMEKIAMYGAGFEAAIMPSLVLLGMALIFFTLGVRLVNFE